MIWSRWRITMINSCWCAVEYTLKLRLKWPGHWQRSSSMTFSKTNGRNALISRMNTLITAVFALMVRYTFSLDTPKLMRMAFMSGMHQMSLRSSMFKSISKVSLSSGKVWYYLLNSFHSWGVHSCHRSATQRLRSWDSAILKASSRSQARCRRNRQVAWSSMMWSMGLSLRRPALQTSISCANTALARPIVKVK